MMTKVHTIMKMNISRYSPYQGRSLLSTALECPSLLHIQIVCSRKTNHSFERLITIVGSIASNWKTPKHDSGIYGDNPIANIYGSPYGYDINASSSRRLWAVFRVRLHFRQSLADAAHKHCAPLAMLSVVRHPQVRLGLCVCERQSRQISRRHIVLGFDHTIIDVIVLSEHV